MPTDDPLQPSQHQQMADRRGADALTKDYRTKGSVRVGRPGRLVGIGVLVVVSLAAIYYLVTLAQVMQTGGSHGADASNPADAIAVMGAAQYDGRPSPQLASRLDHAAELWADGAAPVIVVTGGNIPGDRFTEAEASARYLVGLGVPVEAIVQVGEGNTTVDSVEAAAPVIRDLDIGTIVLVTDPYHSLRSRLIVEGEGFDVDVASTDTSVVTGWSAWRRNLEEAGGVAVGRIIGFDRLSDLTG